MVVFLNEGIKKLPIKLHVYIKPTKKIVTNLFYVTNRNRITMILYWTQ